MELSSGSACLHSLTRWLTNWLSHRTVSNELPQLANLSLFCFFSFITPSLPCSNTAASLLSPPPVSPHSSPVCASPRRASLSWPSRGTSWGPTRPSSPRNIRTPARMAEHLTPLLAGMTWRAQVEEGAWPTVTGPSMALVATSVRTTETQKGKRIRGGATGCGWCRRCPKLLIIIEMLIKTFFLFCSVYNQFTGQVQTQR